MLHSGTDNITAHYVPIPRYSRSINLPFFSVILQALPQNPLHEYPSYPESILLPATYIFRPPTHYQNLFIFLKRRGQLLSVYHMNPQF